MRNLHQGVEVPHNILQEWWIEHLKKHCMNYATHTASCCTPYVHPLLVNRWTNMGSLDSQNRRGPVALIIVTILDPVKYIYPQKPMKLVLVGIVAHWPAPADSTKRLAFLRDELALMAAHDRHIFIATVTPNRSKQFNLRTLPQTEPAII
jgi:hypothetical protein